MDSLESTTSGGSTAKSMNWPMTELRIEIRLKKRMAS